MPDDLDLSVDRTSEIPVGTQLAWKLRMRIAAGQLSPGAQLPGIRELAELAGVNVNTVRSVLAKLEEQGLIVTQQGRGNFVTEAAQPNAQLTQAAEAAAAQATAVGVDPRELAEALYAGRRDLPAAADPAGGLTRPSSVPGAQGRTERKALRSEIAQLERELAEINPLGPAEETRSAEEPRVLTTSELGKVRDELAARIAQVRREHQHWRYENERALAAQRAAEANSRERRWTAGVWTGGKRTDVSWRTT